MGLRLLHTADWHLGQHLHGISRQAEHERFADWLLDELASRRVDALLIAGDVFDSANPPAAASSLWFDFLARAVRRLPGIDIVVVGGNHDSAARLDAPSPVLSQFGVRVVGGPRRAGALRDADEMAVPICDAAGKQAAWVAAVPFLRPQDLPRIEGGEQDLAAGVAAFYARVLDAIRSRRAPWQAIVAMGHCYLTGSRLSEQSERKILGGNLHPVPAEIFPDDVAYAALGHLHLAQLVGRESVRYAGSPIPLSLAERAYPHQVLCVDLDEAACKAIEPVCVPRFCEILRLPEEGELDADAALAELESLERPAAEIEPLVEIVLRLSGPRPGLKDEIESVLACKGVRLAALRVERGPTDAPGSRERTSLAELTPERVLASCWQQQFGDAPLPDSLLAAFAELLDEVLRAEEAV
ncbi:MAG: exonuclease SbcCD subunit D C-terminal domain-containing protein [Deltaproteobacteria bacterium]|nr:exonuclease SbcCD subunit D C-terminal domain-containing protein [Deltaproteobacteria bacterium]